MRSRARWLAVMMLGWSLCPGLAVESSATVGTETLKRSAENILLAPFDLVLTPYVAGDTIAKGIDRANYDNAAQRVMVGMIGYPWILMMDAATAFVRVSAGVFELPVGLATLAWENFTDFHLDPFFDTGDLPAVVDVPSDVFHTKFGVAYVGGETAGR